MSYNERLTSRYIIRKGQNLVETALTDAKYPTSTNFISVVGIPVVHILITLGTIADALTFKVQEANAANGTPADISGLTATIATNDDGEFVYFAFTTNKLTNAYTHITVDVSGNSGSNYATIHYFLEVTSNPATQVTTTTEVLDLD